MSGGSRILVEDLQLLSFTLPYSKTALETHVICCIISLKMDIFCLVHRHVFSLGGVIVYVTCGVNLWSYKRWGPVTLVTPTAHYT
jgi:hypothetical protein